MANTKISDLSAITSLASGDLLVAVDVSDTTMAASGTNKKITKDNALGVNLVDIQGLANTDGNIIVGNGSNFVAESGATARTSLGVTIGTDVQAYDAGLADIAGLAVTNGNVIVGDGANWVAETGDTARISLGVGSSDSPTFAGLTLTNPLTVANGGIGAATLTDGGVLLGSGTGAITAMSVLADGEMIVGDGTTDPVAESGATLRTSIGVGTGDSPTFTGATLSGLTASRLVGTDGLSALASVTDLTSWVAGTSNQITVTDDGDGTLTLSTPQDIATASTVQFGTVGIGTSADRLLHSEVADAGTTTVVYPLRLTHSTSGTAAAGLGVGMEFELEDDDATMDVAGVLDVVWSSSGVGTAAELHINLLDNGSLTEVLEIDGNGTIIVSGDAQSFQFGSLDYFMGPGESRFQVSGTQGCDLLMRSDRNSGNAFQIKGNATSRELTDTNAEQAWLYVEPNINQSGTANYVGLLLDTTETATGSGQDYLMDLRVGGTSKFHVLNNGAMAVAELASDPTAVTNMGYLYTKDVSTVSEVFAMDDGGTATQLTPHNPDTGEWWMNTYFADGTNKKIHIERMLLALCEKAGVDPDEFIEVIENADL